MPPLPEMKKTTGQDQIIDSEKDLLRIGIGQLNPTFVTCTKTIKAIVATSCKTRVIAQDAALAMAGLGFAGCAKTTPHLHRFNPLNLT